MSHSVDTDSQSFWLEHLGNAEALNRWVFAQFAGCLGDDILEVGCGNGNFTVMMGATGARVCGIEIEPSFVKAARQATEHQPTVRIEQADVTVKQWQQKFDTVVMLDVIEHLEDDVGTLDLLHEALRPGGRIVLKVPAMPGVYGTLDEAVGHFRRYTRRTLSQVLSDAGFIDARVHAFNALGVLGWWLNGRLLRRRVPDAGFISGFNAVVPLARALDRIAPPGFGLSLIALAKRRNGA